MSWSAVKLHALRYLVCMYASGLNSGVHAVVAFFGVAGVHAVADSVPALTLQQLIGVFLLAQAKGMLNYLDTHPILAGPAPAPLPLESVLTPETISAIAALVHEKQTAGSPAQPTTTPV